MTTRRAQSPSQATGSAGHSLNQEPSGSAQTRGEEAPASGQGRLTTPVDAKPRLARHFRLQWEEAQGTWVLLYPEGMVKLNQSAGEIARRCDGERTVADIVTDLEAAFGVQGLMADVVAFLDLARERGWLEI